MSNQGNTLPLRGQNPKSAPIPIDHSTVVTIQRTDMSTFDEAFSMLREKFAAEMKRIEEEMERFSSDLKKMHHQPEAKANIANTMAMTSQQDGKAWEALTNSPLVQGDGAERMLNLQFDVSQFEPSEVRVIIEENTLRVTAHHEENTEHSNVMRSFRRDFTLPKEVNPDSVISSLSKDGVLTIRAPLRTDDNYGMSVNHFMSTQPQIACLHRGGFKTGARD